MEAPLFKTAVMEAATGCKLTRYQNWYAEYEKLKPTKPAGFDGKLNLYTLADMYKIALMKFLIDSGMPKARAVQNLEFIKIDNPRADFNGLYLVFFDIHSGQPYKFSTKRRLKGYEPFENLPDEIAKHDGTALIIDMAKFTADINHRVENYKRR